MTEQIVRSCILADDFRPMLPKPEGCFVCQNCGHTVMPANLDYRCRCRNCEELNRSA